MFSEISFITATKPTPTSKLGIKYHGSPAGVIMSGINEGSLFENTKLKAGHLIVSVNGTSMASLTRPQVGAVFGSLTKDICLEVWTPLNCSRDQVPAILSEGGQTPVPLIKWQQIYDQVVNNMIPASNAYKELRNEFQGDMKHFVKNQIDISSKIVWTVFDKKISSKDPIQRGQEDKCLLCFTNIFLYIELILTSLVGI